MGSSHGLIDQLSALSDALDGPREEAEVQARVQSDPTLVERWDRVKAMKPGPDRAAAIADVEARATQVKAAIDQYIQPVKERVAGLKERAAKEPSAVEELKDFYVTQPEWVLDDLRAAEKAELAKPCRRRYMPKPKRDPLLDKALKDRQSKSATAKAIADDQRHPRGRCGGRPQRQQGRAFRAAFRQRRGDRGRARGARAQRGQHAEPHGGKSVTRTRGPGRPDHVHLRAFDPCQSAGAGCTRPSTRAGGRSSSGRAVSSASAAGDVGSGSAAERTRITAVSRIAQQRRFTVIVALGARPRLSNHDPPDGRRFLPALVLGAQGRHGRQPLFPVSA